MIGLDMKMPNTCWDCELTYGHCEIKCFFTHRCVDDCWYSKNRSFDCPLIETQEEQKGGKEK